MKTYDLVQTHSGSQTGDGVMRESEDGEWVKAAELQAALAKVREALEQAAEHLEFYKLPASNADAAKQLREALTLLPAPTGPKV